MFPLELAQLHTALKSIHDPMLSLEELRQQFGKPSLAAPARPLPPANFYTSTVGVSGSPQERNTSRAWLGKEGTMT